MEMAVLASSRLRLRMVAGGDTDVVLEGLSNRELTEYMLIYYADMAAVQEQMDYYSHHHTAGTGCYWAIEMLDTGQVAGVIGMHYPTHDRHKAEIGFWLLPHYVGKGIATEAALAALAYGFDKLRLVRIEATVETENVSSIALLRKIGMMHEGTLRKYENNYGQLIDLMHFSILRDEWERKILD